MRYEHDNRDPFQSKVDALATDFDRRIHLLALGIHSWRVANTMIALPRWVRG